MVTGRTASTRRPARGLFAAPLLAATALAVGLLGASAATAGTLRLAYDSAVGASASLDPISPNRYYMANEMLYSRLVMPDAAGQPTPDLAASWSASPDLENWTFTLRDGVKFHDGSDLTAEDVVYSLMRIKSDVIKSPLRAVLSIIDTVVADDAHTVTIKLSAPFADLPLLLMDYRVRILSSDATHGDTDLANESGVGTGPFEIETYDPQGTTVFKAFDGYFGGRPQVDEVEIYDIADQQAQVQAMLAGQIDYVQSIDEQQAKLFADAAAFKVFSVPTGGWQAIVMMVDKAPFTDQRVRKAMRIAADREAMMTLLVGADGGTVSCDDPVWIGDPYHAASECPQDIDGARKLLADAGYPDGIDVELFTSDLNNLWLKMAQVYQQQVAPAGIRVKITQVPSADYNNYYWMHQPLSQTAWGQRPADQILNEAYQSEATWNETAFKSAALDALLVKARSTADFDARKAIYGEIQQILWEQGGTFIPFHTNVRSVVSTRVTGLPKASLETVHWNEIAVAP
jgi:peptide/nickel transport system substrate-binding protein